MLKLLLKLYPKSFQKEFGEEWLETSRDLLSRAKTRGHFNLINQCIEICFDSSIQAIHNHYLDWQKAVIGEIPVLAGVGVIGKSKLLTKHWIGRPVVSLSNNLSKYWWCFLFGSVVALFAYIFFQQRAVNDPSFDNGTPFYILVSVFILILASFVVTHVESIRSNLKELTLKDVLFRIFHFIFGFYCMLNTILFMDLNREAIYTGSLYEEYNLVGKGIVSTPLSDNINEWSSEYKGWFNKNHTGRIFLKEDKRNEWCGLEGAKLNTWKSAILSKTGNINLSVLLWQSKWSIYYTFDCISEEEWVSGHQEMAYLSRENVGLFHRTWEPFAWTYLLVDRVIAAHYIIWPRLLLSPQKYCTAKAFNISGRAIVDSYKLHEVCSKFATDYEYRDNLIHKLSVTNYYKKQNLKIKPLTKEKREEITKYLEETKNEWIK